MDNTLLQSVSLVAFIISSCLLVAVLARRPVKRWWLQRRAALKDAQAFRAKYGPEAKDQVRRRIEEEPDPGREQHLRRVLKLVGRG